MLAAEADAAGRGDDHRVEIHGTGGSLELGDPNRFDGPVRRHGTDGVAWHDVPLRFDGTVGRGAGASAGGPRALGRSLASLARGASGVDMGRNIFQSDAPTAMIKPAIVR